LPGIHVPRVLSEICGSVGETRTDVITIDGKTPAELPERMVLRSALHITSAWCCAELAQIAIRVAK
jgi:hypothetical protein